MLSKEPESLLTTLTCSGLQPTEDAVAVRSHAEEPQPVHKVMSKKSVTMRMGWSDSIIDGQLADGTEWLRQCGLP